MNHLISACVCLVAVLASWPCAAQDTAVFLSVKNADDPESLYFWWRDDVPQIGPDQDAMLVGLRSGGVQTVQPPDLSRISRVFRQPILSESNAANLARLVGAQRIVVGEIVVAKGDPLGPLRIPEQKLEVTATVVDVTAAGVKASHLGRVNVSAFSHDSGAPYVRLGEELARRMRQPAKSVDVDAPIVRDETLVVLPRDLSSGAQSAVLRRLSDQPNLSFRAAWVNERYLALECNPAQDDTSEFIQKALNLAFAAPFDGFFVKTARSEAVPNALEISVEMAPLAQ